MNPPWSLQRTIALAKMLTEPSSRPYARIFQLTYSQMVTALDRMQNVFLNRRLSSLPWRSGSLGDTGHPSWVSPFPFLCDLGESISASCTSVSLPVQ